jgi:hypothetical protein
MIPELISDELRWGTVIAQSSRLHEGDTLLAVHDVERLPFEREGCAAAIEFAV